MPVWDPQQYARYTSFRSRPFVELVGRIPAEKPSQIVDLGCGDGSLTATLAERWPAAAIEGIDSSPDMLAKAAPRPGLTFRLGNIADWRPAQPVDVIVSNAALQWVDGHIDLLPRFIEGLTPGGFLAFQVPGNFDGPSQGIRPPAWGRSARRPTWLDWPAWIAPSTAGKRPICRCCRARIPYWNG
jgi:trans-aconitate 2-methyltransferase